VNDLKTEHAELLNQAPEEKEKAKEGIEKINNKIRMLNAHRKEKFTKTIQAIPREKI
jgi:hypothetical protein